MTLEFHLGPWYAGLAHAISQGPVMYISFKFCTECWPVHENWLWGKLLITWRIANTTDQGFCLLLFFLESCLIIYQYTTALFECIREGSIVLREKRFPSAEYDHGSMLVTCLISLANPCAWNRCQFRKVIRNENLEGRPTLRHSISQDVPCPKLCNALLFAKNV